MESLVSTSGQRGELTGYLEVLERSGKVAQRIKLSHLPVSIGRAYDNDVIVLDQYVCPHHLRVYRNDIGQITAEDLGSVNGLFVHGNKRTVPKADLSGGQTLSIGHTRIRYRTTHHNVAPTLPDHHTHKLVGAYESRLVQFLVTALAAGTLWLSNFLDIVEKVEPSKPLLQLIYPIAFVVLWASLWAFAGRMTSQKIKLSVHVAIVCTAIVIVFAFDTLLDYFSFAFAVDRYQTAISILGGLLILTGVLYSHLRFCTLASPFRLCIISSAISFSAIGLLAMNAHLESTEFRPGPSFQATLKAPPFRVVSGESVGDFFGRSESLRDRVVSATKD